MGKKTIMNKSLTIILLSLTLMGLSAPAHAFWPVFLIGYYWKSHIAPGPDDESDPVHVVPPFTTDTPWLTDDHIDSSNIPDTAHPSHTAREIDKVFDYLEDKYSDYLPSHQTSYYNQGYRVRYYPGSDGYLYEYEGNVRFSSDKDILAVQTVDKWTELLKAEREEDIEVVFNWLEEAFPDQFPSHQKSYYKGEAKAKADDRHRARYYPSVDGYLTVKDEKVTSSNENDNLEVKTLDEWLKDKKTERRIGIEIDLVFDYLEEKYPRYFPTHQKSYYKDGNRTRYYPSKDGYLFVNESRNVISAGYDTQIGIKHLYTWLQHSGIAADLASKSGTPTLKKDELIEVDLVFDWLEVNNRLYFPRHQKSYNKDGIWTRYYPSKRGYLFFNGETVRHIASPVNSFINKFDHFSDLLEHSRVEEEPGTYENVPPATAHPKHTTKQIDLVFDWMEENYSQYFPSQQKSYYKDGHHRTRYYPSVDGYLFVKDPNVEFSGYIGYAGIMGTNSLDYWLEESGIKDDPNIKDSVFPVTALRMPTKSQINLLYDWFEANYPDYFPSYQASYEWRDGYWTRYYPSTRSYLASKNGYVYFSDNIKEEMGSDSLDYWFEYSGVAKQEEDRLADLLFNWLEKEYSHYLPSHQESYDNDGVRTRYYPSDESYLFFKDGSVHLHRYDGHEKEEVFTLEVWLNFSGIAADEKSGEADRVEAQHLEAERKEAGRPEAERLEAERLEAERIEAERVEAARIEAEAARLEAERVEAERVEAERVEAARIEAARIEAERVEAARIEAERVEAARIEAERVEAERVEAERVEAEKAEAARIEAERQAEHPDYSFSQIDLLFYSLEGAYPDSFPSSQQSYYEDGYRTRYYPSVDTYIYVKGSRFYLYIPNKHVMDLGLDELFERLGIAED